jgi:osmotically-inducible protein OsmY
VHDRYSGIKDHLRFAGEKTLDYSCPLPGHRQSALKGVHMPARAILGAVSATVIALSLAVAGCSVTSGQESMGSYMDDATITGDVKGAINNDSGLPVSAISVETMKGEVLLSGFVKTQAEKDRAGTLAHGVKGVTSVRNDIVVRP